MISVAHLFCPRPAPFFSTGRTAGIQIMQDTFIPLKRTCPALSVFEFLPRCTTKLSSLQRHPGNMPMQISFLLCNGSDPVPLMEKDVHGTPHLSPSRGEGRLAASSTWLASLPIKNEDIREMPKCPRRFRTKHSAHNARRKNIFLS